MANGVVNKFNRGEIDTLALAREDVKRVNNSASSMVNFIPTRLGPMVYRPGLENIHAFVAGNHHLTPFVAAIDDTAIVDFTDGTSSKFIVNDVAAAITSVTSSITNGSFISNIANWTDASSGSASTAWYSTGALALTGDGTSNAVSYQVITSTQTGVQHTIIIVIERAPVVVKLGTTGASSYDIFNGALKPGTHKLTFTPSANVTITFANSRKYRALVSSVSFDVTSELSVTSNISSLQSLRTVQSGDIIYCAHTGAPFQIEHRADKSWSIVDFRSDDGPFEAVNNTDITLAPAAINGDTVLAASESFFSLNHVGALFKIVSAGQTVSTTVAIDSGAGTNSIRVFGVGTARAFTVNVTFPSYPNATVTLQQSADDATWSDVESYTADQSKSYNDAQDNAILYYRLYIKSGDNPLADTGAHDGAGNAAVLTDSTKSWTIDEHVGRTISNTTDGSSATITANTATTVTGVLSGGTDDDWDVSDAYEISRDSVSLSLVYAAGSIEGICRVTEYTTDIAVNVQVLKDFGDTGATKDWYEGSWSAVRQYPSAVDLSEGRLWFAGTDQIWGSVSDSFYSLDRSIEGNSASIMRTIGFGPVDPVKWLKDAGKLIMATASDELSIRSNSFGELMTPTNANIKSGSNQGADNIEPVKVGSLIYFVQRSGVKIYSIGSAMDEDKFSTLDANLLNQTVTSVGIVRLAFTHQPETRIFAVLSDGNVAVYTVDSSEEAAAWSRLQVDGTVKDVIVLPDTGEDRVYFVVDRANGLYLEKMAKFSEAKGGTISKTFDSFKAYTSPGITITGLPHSDGQIVGVWADGQDRGTYTVASGSITVASSWTDVIVGLPYVADYVSNKLSGYTDGSALAMRKRIVDTGIVLADYWPGSIKIGPNVALLKQLPGIEDGKAVDATATIAEYNELPFEFNGETESDPRIYMRATGPCTILALTYDVDDDETADPSSN